jgi:hypothetical protein
LEIQKTGKIKNFRIKQKELTKGFGRKGVPLRQDKTFFEPTDRKIAKVSSERMSGIIWVPGFPISAKQNKSPVESAGVSFRGRTTRNNANENMKGQRTHM